MPWHVARSSECPVSKPFAVIKDDDGSVEGCHETEEAAKAQMRALYASEGVEVEQRSGQVRHKAVEAEMVPLDEQGAFEAKFSAFNNIDLVGDRIRPEAFNKTLERWRSNGDPVPVVFSHAWDDPWYHIGISQPAELAVTKDGVTARGKLDIEDNPLAKQVFKLMKRRSLKSWSFGYTVPKGGEKMSKDGVNDITELDLIEIGPTLKGANPEAQLQATKALAQLEAKQDPPEDKPNVVVVDNKQLTVAHDTERCPVDRPWAMTEEGELVSCHMSEDEARGAMQQMMKGASTDSDEKTLRKRTDDMRLEQARGGLKAEKSETVSEEDRIRALVKETLIGALGDDAVKEQLKSLLPQQLTEADVKALKALVTASDEEPLEAKSAPQDPLKKRTYDLALEVSSGGQKARRVELEPEPEPPLDETELRRRTDELRLEIARGN